MSTSKQKFIFTWLKTVLQNLDIEKFIAKVKKQLRE